MTRNSKNTLRSVTALIGLLLTGPFAAPVQAALPNRASIRPGIGLGGLTLGSSHASIEKQIGKPDSVHPLRNGLTEDCWHRGKASYGPGVTILFRGGRAVQIETDLPSIQSPGGISVGSNFLKVLKRYKDLRVGAYGWTGLDDEGGYVRYYYDDVKAGIAFTLGTQDDEATSESLSSAQPGNEITKPESILIHLPGHPVIAATGTARVRRETVSPAPRPQRLYSVIKTKGL